MMHPYQDYKDRKSEGFLHRADIAMYTAKKKNDGVIVVAAAELTDQFEKDKNLKKTAPWFNLPTCCFFIL